MQTKDVWEQNSMRTLEPEIGEVRGRRRKPCNEELYNLYS
jgi:hypothetical protein